MIKSKTAIIINIGDELLNGRRINTNLNWLCSELLKINISTSKAVCIKDEINQINRQLSNISNSNYVFITGGLGCTSDDLTVEAISGYLKEDTYFDEEYYDKLKKEFNKKSLPVTDLLKKQAIKIRNVKYIKNPRGSAEAFYFKIKDCTYFVLPGVPNEMKYIFLNTIKAILSNNDRAINSYTVQTFGLTESYISTKIDNIMKKNNNVKFSFLPSFKRVSVIITSFDLGQLKKVRSEIVKKLEHYIFSIKDESLVEVIANMMISRKLTLSTCESCTGGKLSSILTSIDGSSSYYKGSFIVYSDQIKNQLLQIDSKKILKHGSVSSQIAKEMVISASNIISTDISIAITGLSGPNSDSSNKKIGTVFIAIKYFEEIFISEYKLNYDRETHRFIASQIALNNLRLIMMNKWSDNIYKFK